MFKRMSGFVDWQRYLLLAPVTVLLVAAFALPLMAIAPEAFGGDGWGRFARIFGSPVYRTVAWTTVRISLEATALTLVVSFPLAWMLSRATGLRAILLGLLVLIPFLTSVLVRTFAWLAILGQHGLVNALLLGLGLIGAPLPLLFSEGAVVLALVQCSIPLMVFALVTVLRRIDGRLILAASTLGANPLRIWSGVLLPLAVRGIQSGVTIIFLFTMASFIAPSFLGNQRQQMLAQVVQSEIDVGSDWALAAALGITLALIATVVVTALSSVARYLSRWQRPGLRTPPPPPMRVNRSILQTPTKLPPSRPSDLLALSRITRVAGPVYLALASILILLPLVVLVPVAFSSADVLVFPPPGYSLRWFKTILGNQDWIDATLTSLRIAGATCCATLVLATLTVLGFGRRQGHRGVAEALLLSPLTVPSVVFALGAYLAFSRVGLVDTETGIILAHTVLIFPIVHQVVSATYSTVDSWLPLAAASLGASPLRIFRTVIFPLIIPGLGVGALLAILSSFDESVASIFLSNLSVKTLPRKLWEGIRFNTSPESAAVSVVLMALTCAMVLVGVWVVLGRRRSSLVPGQAHPEPV